MYVLHYLEGPVSIQLRSRREEGYDGTCFIQFRHVKKEIMKVLITGRDGRNDF